MRILVLEHDRDAPAGLFAEWAEDRRHTLSVLEVPRLARWPSHSDAPDAVVSLGSEQSVASPAAGWIAAELRYLRELHGNGVPVLGICFGAQALAAALGGSVAPAARLSVEWSELDWREEQLIPAGPWLRWHEDVFTVPPRAREIAAARGVPMGFASGRSVALQFHPEADAPIARGWIASRNARGEQAPELAAVQHALEADAEGARSRALELFDRIAHGWSRS